MWLSEPIPADEVTGAGLALRHRGRYLFMLAGRRHTQGDQGTFFAGIGGHCEPGEAWCNCARREALEELGAAVAIHPAAQTTDILRNASRRRYNP
jgi:8-oxo-dGTP pyrophosphatase MutT (NUDIX family)